MALLFPREEDKDFAATTDAATRSLSAISLETSFVEGVYEKMASVYDLFFGLSLHHGRAKAIRRMAIKPGDQILEVGVGTGISLPLYPRTMFGDGDRSLRGHARARAHARRAIQPPQRASHSDGRDAS